MNFYVWWLVSIGASFLMDLQNSLRLFKDAADAGYKINLDKFKKMSSEEDEVSTKVNTLKLFIPGFNILSVFQKAYEYNQTRPFILDELNVMGVLDEMSIEEKREYQKNRQD